MRSVIRNCFFFLFFLEFGLFMINRNNWCKKRIIIFLIRVKSKSSNKSSCKTISNLYNNQWAPLVFIRTLQVLGFQKQEFNCISKELKSGSDVFNPFQKN